MKDSYYYYVSYYKANDENEQPVQYKEKFNNEEEARLFYNEALNNPENIQVELILPEAPMPKSVKDQIYSILARYNGFSKENDYSIEDLLKALKEANFKPYIDEVLGYKETLNGGKVKQYVIKFEGYQNHFLVEFYMDDNYKTNETNFYFTDSIKDSEMIIDIDYAKEAEELKEATVEMKEAVNEVVIEKPFDKFSAEIKNRLKKAENKEHELDYILEEIDDYCSKNSISMEQQEKLEDELWEITKSV